MIQKARVKCTNSPVLTLRGWIKAGIVLGDLEERTRKTEHQLELVRKLILCCCQFVSTQSLCFCLNLISSLTGGRESPKICTTTDCKVSVEIIFLLPAFSLDSSGQTAGKVSSKSSNLCSASGAGLVSRSIIH